MSSRPIVGPHLLISSGDMSGNITSSPTILTNISMLSYDVSWSGTSPVGAITIQVSNTYRQNPDGSVAVAGSWNNLPLSAATAVSGNSGNGFIDIDATAGYAVRIVYTRTSGTGTLNVTVSGKVT